MALILTLMIGCERPDDLTTGGPPEVGTQKYLEQASICSMYFTYVGKKDLGYMALMNAVSEVSSNNNLELYDMGALEILAASEVERVRSFFSEAEVSKKEASFYLLSENDCLVHASLGRLYAATLKEL